MECYNPKNYREFSEAEEPEEEEEKENEDNNIDEIINGLQSKLDNVSQNIQDIPNELSTSYSFQSRNITPNKKKLTKTLMSDRTQISNSKTNSSNNSNVNEITEKDDEIDITSIISGYSVSKNNGKNNSNSLSINVNIYPEEKNDIETKKDVKFIINNLKTIHHYNTDSNMMNTQIDNSNFTINKCNDISEILQSKIFQKENQEKRESKELFKDKINETVNEQNKMDENLCKKNNGKKFINIFKYKEKNKFYKCTKVNCFCNYSSKNICKYCKNLNSLACIRNIFIFVIIISIVSFYIFLTFFS